MERWPFFAQLAPTAMARESLLRLIAALPLPRPIALHLDLARNSRPGLFTHGILMALLCAYLAGAERGLDPRRRRRRCRRRPAARPRHAAHRPGAARRRRAPERQPPQSGLRPSAHRVDAGRALRRLSEAGGPRRRRASRAARRLRLSARPRRRGDQPARPDRLAGRGGDGDVRRRAGAARAARLAAAAHQPAALRPGAGCRGPSPARGAAGQRGRRRRHARAFDRPAAAPGRRARALARDQRGDRPRSSTAPTRRCWCR